MGTTDVTPYNDLGDAVAVVKRDSTASALPEGAPNLAITIVGGPGGGSPEAYRALAVVRAGDTIPATPGLAMLGASDGSAARAFSVDTNGKLRTLMHDGSGTAITATGGALDVNIKSTTGAGNLPVDIAAQSLTAVKISATSAANALSNPLFTRLSDADNNGALVRRNTAPSATQGVFPIGVFDGTSVQLASADTSGRLRSLTLDGSGNSITSKLTGSDRSLAVAAADGSGNLLDSVLNSVRALFVALRDSAGNGLTSSSGGASARNLDIVVRDVFGPVANHVAVTNTVTTTSTAANQTVVSYTVPAGKDFLYAGGWFGKDGAASAVDMSPASLRVNGVNLASYQSASTSDRKWELPRPSFPVKIATAGQAVTISVTPGAATSTAWRGALFGFLRDI